MNPEPLRDALIAVIGDSHAAECTSSSSDGTSYARCACGAEFTSQQPCADDECAHALLYAHQIDQSLAVLGEYPEEVIELLGGKQVGWHTPGMPSGADVGSLFDGRMNDDDVPVYAFPASPSTSEATKP